MGIVHWGSCNPGVESVDHKNEAFVQEYREQVAEAERWSFSDVACLGHISPLENDGKSFRPAGFVVVERKFALGE